MACKNVRVKGYTVKTYRVKATRKHKAYTVKTHRVPGHTRKVC